MWTVETNFVVWSWNCVDNHDNFREFIRFRVDSDDHVLQNNLEMSCKNTSYLGLLFHNQTILIYNKIFLKQLVNNVNKAKGFTILDDETTENKSHYVSVMFTIKKNWEDFFQFVEIYVIFGKWVEKIILYLMKKKKK